MTTPTAAEQALYAAARADSVEAFRTPRKAVYHSKRPEALTRDGWVYKEEDWDVRVMAVNRGYAMVRRPGCMPFVCRTKDLKFPIRQPTRRSTP